MPHPLFNCGLCSVLCCHSLGSITSLCLPRSFPQIIIYVKRLWVAVKLLPICFNEQFIMVVIICKSPTWQKAHLYVRYPISFGYWPDRFKLTRLAYFFRFKQCHLSGPRQCGFSVGLPTLWNEVPPRFRYYPPYWHSRVP